MTIDRERRRLLREAFARGEHPIIAALSAHVSDPTAHRYFRRWGWCGGVGPRRRFKPQPKLPGLPAYDGPDWIGKAC